MKERERERERGNGGRMRNRSQLPSEEINALHQSSFRLQVLRHGWKETERERMVESKRKRQ